jgi:hypothetical protein
VTVNHEAVVLFCKEQAMSELIVTLEAKDQEEVFNIFLKVIVIWPEQAASLNQTESPVNDTISEEEKETISEDEGEKNVN